VHIPRSAMLCRRDSGELTGCLAICQLLCYHALVQSRCSMRESLEENVTEWKLPARGEKLTLVLAVGSNAAPTQLACKFEHHGVVIPVLRCVLPDFDVVHAPAITSCGSCPGEASHDPASVHDSASVRGFCTDISFTTGGHAALPCSPCGHL